MIYLISFAIVAVLLHTAIWQVALRIRNASSRKPARKSSQPQRKAPQARTAPKAPRTARRSDLDRLSDWVGYADAAANGGAVGTDGSYQISLF